VDQNPSQEDMNKLDAEPTRLGKPRLLPTYPGAAHAFMDFGQPHRYNEEAADAGVLRAVPVMSSSHQLNQNSSLRPLSPASMRLMNDSFVNDSGIEKQAFPG